MKLDRRTRWLALYVLCLGDLMIVLDSSIVNVALPSIQTDLGFSQAALDAGVALSENLLGAVFVNQSAAYSDFHGTGANPAATASYTDGAYVASRFRVVQSRRHI